jgi:hypothetical protein
MVGLDKGTGIIIAGDGLMIGWVGLAGLGWLGGTGGGALRFVLELFELMKATG